ncbi:hypothetical protein [Staphylococcus aureus]|uniref:hypothetical protein n=1 Tax=Staphylococcus aureus TaxID=1280 RepID=UPI000445EDE3|nr:hypothetical protein [Staphylococcus aureus]EZY68274.1 hypothetical protein V063_02673 [Staphylococcus aureus R0487]
MTSRYIGFVDNDTLMSMMPIEWNDWVIGAKQALIDQRETLLHGAQYNTVAQAGKSLKRFAKQIEKEHYIVSGREDEYHRMKQRQLAKNKRIRELHKRGTRRFINSLNTSQRGG